MVSLIANELNNYGRSVHCLAPLPQLFPKPEREFTSGGEHFGGSKSDWLIETLLNKRYELTLLVSSKEPTNLFHD